MTLLATLLWPLAAASALLGGAIGALTGLPRTPTARRSAGLLVLAAGLAGGLAAGGFLSGRAGFWLEAGALGLGSYLIGAILAAGVTDRMGTRS
ncbi:MULTISPECIES: hypothetical protein [unclassified Methylobacterium]|uniref:hypothetical protein n=1 Tax=unclassified Methylobacterium TaxID=2615210 RepID=UPI0006FAAC6B|nr:MULTISPECIES: hypothetical protein [unclassified Methylobacterium]KQO73268.1 hypothetical protein ASF20_16255 [Methylobacterium sp. Leaf88]KQU26302.1 hypothetical protein ASG63_19480 [Methylobacterium sp. Leaf94]